MLDHCPLSADYREKQVFEPFLKVCAARAPSGGCSHEDPGWYVFDVGQVDGLLCVSEPQPWQQPPRHTRKASY